MDDSNVLVKKLYPLIRDALSKNSNKFKQNIQKFINDRHDLLFDIAPYDRIYFNQKDIDDMYKALGITELQVKNIMEECFFWDTPYNPQCAKEPYVMTLMMSIRCYLLQNKRKDAELTTIYLAFSGKFYTSLHAGAAFPKVPPSKYKSVMDYVVNNMLSDKFSLKKEGTVFGAIRSLCVTWLDKYEGEIKSEKSSDDRFGKLVQQLRDREKSFLMNIAKPYYEVWQNHDTYLNYETDSLDENTYRLTDNDAAIAARLTENTMNYLTSNYVSFDICNKCKNENVKAIEIKDIIESIIGDNQNLQDIRRVVNILICDFMRSENKTKVGSVDFVAYSMKPKPNTKDPYQIELKNIILNWLDENSPTYRKRKSRQATAISYYKSILLYFVKVINKVALANHM